ncbi:hypothetical protein KEU06_28715 [Pseudaminobacter sp. 19-2017]|uniref:Uncharacterized protein n=1 Tax=Pseudaminobacter soli (ex Zhang et al. 2022) TaxID=2831468 RepID=A0A942I564_9HYPH|nr:hypothetical protein [Pseudaminobacter soli]MBS3652564.1 hypothetical protein [Pseudaminobacter soli]
MLQFTKGPGCISVFAGFDVEKIVAQRRPAGFARLRQRRPAAMFRSVRMHPSTTSSSGDLVLRPADVHRLAQTKHRGPHGRGPRPSNDLVIQVSDALSVGRSYAKIASAPLSHEITWDAELSAAAALCVARLLEQRSDFCASARKVTLAQAAEFWLQNKDWCEQHGRVGGAAHGARASALQAGASALDAGTFDRARRVFSPIALCR